MDYDVIIIGSGAGGGTLAHRLAPSGLRVLVLERGEPIPRERENWDEREVFERKRYLARETWYDRDDQPFSPYTHYCVGGNTKVYGAALLRLRETDFGEVRHYGGVSPAWPISYRDLEAYYTQAERQYHVHGVRGADPTEPPTDAPLVGPPLAPEARIAELFDDLTALGYRPFPIPLGVRLDVRGRGESPARLGAFDGYPDPTLTKSDAQTCAVAPALAHDTVEIRTGVRVERLLVDRTGRGVRAVECVGPDGPETFRAGVVVLAAGAINSAAILLRSACTGHEGGLANASGLVGRNYMCHQNGCLISVEGEPNTLEFQKHFGLADFYHGAEDSTLPLGLVQLMGKPDRATLEWLRGTALAGVALDDIRRRTVDFFLTAEDLPDPSNRVELRADGSIRLVYARNNTEAYDRLREKVCHALLAAQARRGRARPTFLHERLGISGVSHQSGTLRFGLDPRTSVLDPSCRAHGLDNLYVADASFFPSSAAVNPSLTIMANALRVGDIIIDRLGAARPRHLERARA